MPPVVPPRSGNCPSIAGLVGVQGVSPTIIQVRRCGRRMRLAIDGLCYPRGLLTARLRETKSNRAYVSRREYASVSKAAQVGKRLDRLAKKRREASRALYKPPPRRRRSKD